MPVSVADAVVVVNRVLGVAAVRSILAVDVFAAAATVIPALEVAKVPALAPSSAAEVEKAAPAGVVTEPDRMVAVAVTAADVEAKPAALMVGVFSVNSVPPIPTALTVVILIATTSELQVDEPDEHTPIVEPVVDPIVTFAETPEPAVAV